MHAPSTRRYAHLVPLPHSDNDAPSLPALLAPPLDRARPTDSGIAARRRGVSRPAASVPR